MSKYGPPIFNPPTFHPQNSATYSVPNLKPVAEDEMCEN